MKRLATLLLLASLSAACENEQCQPFSTRCLQGSPQICTPNGRSWRTTMVCSRVRSGDGDPLQCCQGQDQRHTCMPQARCAP